MYNLGKFKPCEQVLARLAVADPFLAHSSILLVHWYSTDSLTLSSAGGPVKKLSVHCRFI